MQRQRHRQRQRQRQRPQSAELHGGKLQSSEADAHDNTAALDKDELMDAHDLEEVHEELALAQENLHDHVLDVEPVLQHGAQRGEKRRDLGGGSSR